MALRFNARVAQIPLLLVVNLEDGNVTGTINTNKISLIDKGVTLVVNIEDGDQNAASADHLVLDLTKSQISRVEEGITVSDRGQGRRQKDEVSRGNNVVTLDEEAITLDDDIGAGISTERSTTSGTSQRASGASSEKDELGVNFDDGIAELANKFLGGEALALVGFAVTLTALGLTLVVANFATVRSGGRR
jgi:hypothetical protein